MKRLHITIDDRLLARLDADPEVKRLGRSAIVRRAVDLHLTQRRKRAVGDAYRKAYGGLAGSIPELEKWAAEGVLRTL